MSLNPDAFSFLLSKVSNLYVNILGLDLTLDSKFSTILPFDAMIQKSDAIFYYPLGCYGMKGQFGLLQVGNWMEKLRKR